MVGIAVIEMTRKACQWDELQDAEPIWNDESDRPDRLVNGACPGRALGGG